MGGAGRSQAASHVDVTVHNLRERWGLNVATYVDPTQLREAWLAAQVLADEVVEPVQFPLTVTVSSRPIEISMGRSQTVTLQVLEGSQAWIAFGPVLNRFVILRGHGVAVGDVVLRQVSDLSAIPEHRW